MKYLHTMIRIRDVDASLRFFCEGLGLQLKRRDDYPQGKFSLIFLAAPDSPDAEIELTWNWPDADGNTEDYGSARNFGHLAFRVGNIYDTCAHLQAMGYTINRPPRDGHMAFVRSPDLVSVELLQEGNLPPAEPWASMPNTGVW
jgi:lactoylglutathione lyase